MCYDMCLRAIDDALQTFGSMRYRRVGEEQASPAAEAEVAALVEHSGRFASGWAAMKGPTWTRRSSATPATSTITTTT